MSTLKVWLIGLGIGVLAIGAPFAAVGIYWHLHDATPHKTKWNDLYSQPTFPLDDDPTTRPMAFDSATRTP